MPPRSGGNLTSDPEGPDTLTPGSTRPSPHRITHAQIRRDSLTLVNPCCMAYGFIVVGMAIAPFLRCLIVGRRSSRSRSFVLRRSSAMSVGRALHLELSSAPTGIGSYRRIGRV